MVRTPKKVTNPALKACDWFFPAINSPTKAPIKRPKKIPNGGKNITPVIIPITAKITPVRDAPNFFAPAKGRI